MFFGFNCGKKKIHFPKVTANDPINETRIYINVKDNSNY